MTETRFLFLGYWTSKTVYNCWYGLDEEMLNVIDYKVVYLNNKPTKRHLSNGQDNRRYLKRVFLD